MLFHVHFLPSGLVWLWPRRRYVESALSQRCPLRVLVFVCCWFVRTASIDISLHIAPHMPIFDEYWSLLRIRVHLAIYLCQPECAAKTRQKIKYMRSAHRVQCEHFWVPTNAQKIIHNTRNRALKNRSNIRLCVCVCVWIGIMRRNWQLANTVHTPEIFFHFYFCIAVRCGCSLLALCVLIACRACKKGAC